MESIENAKKVGMRFGILSSLMFVGLMIVALIFAMYFELDDFASSVVSVFYILGYDRLPETILGLGVMALMVWKLSPNVGVKIIVGEEEYAKEGGLFMLLIFLAVSTVMLLGNYIHAGLKSSVEFKNLSDNLFIPAVWALIIGFIPLATAGIWMGSKIDRTS